MVTRDDSWELTLAITGDPDQATDQLFASHIVAMINALREERDHLLNQLAAAREHVEVIVAKRAYTVNPWIHNDVATLQRLLAEHVPTWREEIAKSEQREVEGEVK